MPRIPYPDPESLSAETQGLLDRLAPLNIFRMMSHAPHILEAFVQLGSSFLYKGKLDPVLREVAILRVGYLSGARYETAQHEKIGRDVGMTDALIEAIRLDGSLDQCTTQQQLVVRFVDDLVHNVKASDSLFNDVIGTFGAEQAQELTLVTGYYMMVCRFLETFEVDIETGGAKGLALPGKQT